MPFFQSIWWAAYLHNRCYGFLDTDDAHGLVDEQVYDEDVSWVLQKHVVSQGAMVAQS